MNSPKLTVRARKHHGTGSFDLTLPSNLTKKHGVQVGDVFEVSVYTLKNELKIIYKRVYEQPKK